MDPTKFCTFFAPSCDLLDPKNSCDLMDPNQNFPLTNPHVIWWTQVYKGFQLFLPLAPSCVLMDPLLDQNLMCFPGPKPHVSWWTVDDFQGPSNQMRFLGPQKRRSTQKTHVIWWTQPNFFTTSCALMDPDFKPHWVHQITWVKILPIFCRLMCFDGPRLSNLIRSIKSHEFLGSSKSHEVLKNGQNLDRSIKSHECQKYNE